MIVNPGLTKGGAGANLIRSLNPAAWFRFGIGVSASQWTDQSGNGRHLLQATATNQPAVQTDGSLLFDGADNFMKCDAFTLNQPETVYFLGKQVTYTLDDTIWDGNATNSGRCFQQTNSPEIKAHAGTGSSANSDLAVDTYGVVVAVYNGANSLIQVNNGTPVTGNFGAANMGGFMIGSDGTGTARWGHIQVKEVILFAAAHDAATRARVVRYLSRVGNLSL
jgi:hypothetical protein